MNSDEKIRQAQESFRTITELKKKLERLTEHVESRKESLEEEIEEITQLTIVNNSFHELSSLELRSKFCIKFFKLIL